MMKVVRVNYAHSNAAITNTVRDIHDLQLEMEEVGVKVTLTVKGRDLIVTIDPIGRNFIDRIVNDEVQINRSQTRIVVTGDRSAFAPPSLQD